MRICAALLVFFFHAKYVRFDGKWFSGVGAYGHDAVIVFFVLSGLVIAFVSNTKERNVGDYAKSRFARLYSVAFPALLLTLVADYIGRSIDPSMYDGGMFKDSQPVLRFLANLFFVNEIWFSSWRAFSNGPFWSLSYEFWYYVIFAAFFYFTGVKRLLLTIAALLVAGPKILILLPVWLMGVATYYLSGKVVLGRVASISLALIPLLLYSIYRDMHLNSMLLHDTIDALGRDFVYSTLQKSRRFFNDYFVGLLTCIHIIGIAALARHVSFHALVEKPVRYLAACSFSLYLFHYPLLQLYGSLLHNGILNVVLTLLTVLLLAPVTEGKKRAWRQAIDRIGERANRLIGAVFRGKANPSVDAK